TIPEALAFGAGQGIAASAPGSAAALAARVSMAMAVPTLGVIVSLLMVAAALGAGIAFRGPSAQPDPQTQDQASRADLVASEKPIQQPPASFWDQSAVPVDVRGRV